MKVFGKIAPNTILETLDHPKFITVPYESALRNPHEVSRESPCPSVSSCPSLHDSSHPLSQIVSTCFSSSREMVTLSLECGIPVSSVSTIQLPGFQIGIVKIEDRGQGPSWQAYYASFPQTVIVWPPVSAPRPGFSVYIVSLFLIYHVIQED